MKRRQTEALTGLMLASSLTLASCGFDAEPGSALAGGQYVSGARDSGGSYQRPDDDGSWSATVDVYRIDAESSSDRIISDEAIRRQFGLAANYLAFETNDNFIMRLGAVGDLALKPTGYEPDTATSCYQRSDIDRASRRLQGWRLDGGRLIQLIANSVPLCGDDDSHGQPAKAYAIDNVSAYNLAPADSGTARQSEYVAQHILHEVGHNLGLDHFRKYNCVNPGKSIDRATDDMLADIATVLDNPNCTVERGASGQLNDYASGQSVMGGRAMSEQAFEAGTETAYATIDVAQLMPQSFRLTTVEPSPAEFELAYGADRQNGIVIELPQRHPLKQIDPDISRLVVTVENPGVHDFAQPFAQPRSCQTATNCVVSVAVSDERGGHRYELDRTPDYHVSQPNEGAYAVSERLIYLDKQMNFGMIAREEYGRNPLVTIVDYPTAWRQAQKQRQAYMTREYGAQPVRLGS